jgi:DNA-binding response OmpR family regulator
MAPRHVLLIDDQPSLLHFLRHSIEDHWPGCVVDTADSTNDARALLRAGRYDVILTDYNLHDGTGLQLAAMARRRLPAVPILLMTASPTPTLEAKVGVRHGSIRSLLRKPFDLEQLYDALESLETHNGPDLARG